MIKVPFGVGLVIVGLGIVIWVVEWGQKAHRHMKRREAGRELARDLTAPQPPARLPYGLPVSPGPAGPSAPARTPSRPGAAPEVSNRLAPQRTEDSRPTVDPGEDLQASHRLGMAHWERFQDSPDGDGHEDFDTAVRLLHRVYEVDPRSVPEPLQVLFADAAAGNGSVEALLANNRAMGLLEAFQRTGQLPLLQEAVATLRDGFQAFPDGHPDRALHLSDLAAMLQELFEQTGDIGALTEAVQAGRQAAAAAPEDHPLRATILSNLGNELRSLFERTGDAEVLAEAIAVGRQAVETTPEDPDYAIYLSNLGNSLQALFERNGDAGALAEAVRLGRQALAAAPEDHPDRPKILNNLGTALHALFKRTGDTEALAEAIAVGRRSAETTSEDQPVSLSNLGSALGKLFERTGDVEVLAEAVRTGRRAVAATPDDHPDRAGRLNNLMTDLLALYSRTGEAEVLAEAIRAGRQAASSTPEDHPQRATVLSNLASLLLTDYDRSGDPGALNDAVILGREVVTATPEDHPDLAGYLTNFGNALQVLSEQTEGQLGTEVLTDAVRIARHAVAILPEDHPDRAKYLSNLGNALWMLFERTEDIEALTEAVQAGRQAVAANPEGHPDRAVHESNLGNALRPLFERTRDAAVLAEGLAGYRSASHNTAAALIVRVRALRELASLAGAGGTLEGEALAAVESAVALLPQISPRTLARGDREHQLGQLGSLADVAAAAALSAGSPQRAVELLEATRGMLAADALDARSGDVARLRARDPGLARHFEDLRDRRDAMDRSGAWPDPRAAAAAGGFDRGFDRGFDPARDPRAEARRQAQAEWDDLIGRIRALDGFSGFLAAPPIAELTAQARQGKIVFLTAGPTRCDALIITGDPADPVRTVALDRLRQRDARTRVDRLRKASRTASGRDFSPEADTGGQEEILDTLAWLWDTVAEPVLTALGHTGTPPEDEEWPRIWWCPVGIMGYLPLHAAGHHGDLRAADPAVRSAPRTVLDRVVSSYTPTVRALAYARSHPPTAADATLVVAVPDAPGASRLPGVEAEADAITALVPQALRPDHPVRADVLKALPTHPVAHLACHGLADLNNPAGSRLILHDHQTEPLTVADISALHLTGTLAYLSACDTSSTSLRLADEALHLTGAFHLAGYQNVVGTLWPVNDGTAAQIATAFYTRLTAGGTRLPDTALSARALHDVVRVLREDRLTTPTYWAAHTHTGI